MTFKEYLKEKADKNQKDINISDHIESIKEKLETNFFKRRFVISFIDIKTQQLIAFGSDASSINIFIPKNVSPKFYIDLFISALEKELGFSRADIEVSEDKTNKADFYNIMLCW